MALKEEETSSSDEEGGGGEDDSNSDVNEGFERETDTEDDDEDKVGSAAITAVEKSAKDDVKSEGGKLDKAGLNEFLVKLRRPITQAKVTLHFLLEPFLGVAEINRHISYFIRFQS